MNAPSDVRLKCLVDVQGGNGVASPPEDLGCETLAGTDHEYAPNILESLQIPVLVVRVDERGKRKIGHPLLAVNRHYGRFRNIADALGRHC